MLTPAKRVTPINCNLNASHWLAAREANCAFWLASNNSSFSCLKRGIVRNALILVKPLRVSLKWAYRGDNVTLNNRFTSLDVNLKDNKEFRNVTFDNYC